MRFRTKLFIAWGVVILLLCAGIFWPVQRAISVSLNNMTNANFAGTRQSLRSMQGQQIERMRQAGRMLMDIPDLRALIAEQNYEISQENRDSLEERLNNLSDLISVRFACVLDARKSLIAQNSASPWTSLTELNNYVSHSQLALPLINNLYARSRTGKTDGLWAYRGQMYQVVGLPLIFGPAKDSSSPTDGALIMAAPVNNKMAEDLAAGHNCQITFFADGIPIACSLPQSLRDHLQSEYTENHWPLSTPFDVVLNGIAYRSYLEPLIDQGSGKTVGFMLIQSSLADGDAAKAKISASLLAIMSAGLIAAAIISFLLSGAVTRPVSDLVHGVRGVAGGNLDLYIPVSRGDELGELAGAFNDMLAKLRKQRELQRLVEESQAASKAKSQFLANMSHEIRTPLHGVIGMANLLLRTDLNDRQRRYARLVKSSSEVLTTLINDILDFSKIEAGRLELDSVDFHVHSVVEDVVELLSQKAIEKNVEISCHISTGVPLTLRGDANRLRQILLNLIGNAVKFTERGEVVVRVTQTSATGGRMLIHFAVTDSGVGIPAKRIDRLFKSFSQIDASTTRRYGGTGLGLAICKQLTELMGGGIGVSSELGKGSTFWFTVNLTAIDCPLNIPPKELAGVRVLVVDDNSSTRQILQQQLGEAGMTAVSASPADVPPRLNEPYAIVIVDRHMHDTDGLKLGRRIKEQCPDARLLLLTHVQEELKTASLVAAGFIGTLTKPIRRTTLIHTICDTLGHSGVVPTEQTPAPDALIKATNRFRILLAEDNEINQIVACDFLSQAGYECEVVADGAQAVAAATQAAYDLTLMDCQMPEMDGFEATRAIRRHEQQRAGAGQPPRRMPIIALTANASGADRARCIEAGMDDYCGKPFQPQELLQTIASFLAQSAPVNSLDAGSEPAHGKPPFELTRLLERCTGNPKLASVILEKFEKQTATCLADLQKSLADGDGEKLAQLSHALKGTAGVVAAEQLRLAAGQLEQFGRDNTLDLAQTSLEALRAEVARCGVYIATARAQLQQTVQEKETDASSNR